MFSHIYKYRIKCVIRDKQMMFWILVFPILLSVFFQMTLGNITKAEAFNQIEIAVVDDDEFKKETDFKEVLSSISSDGKNNKKMFDITYTNVKNAKNLLKDGDVQGYIYVENGIQLVVKNLGLSQTIIKSFLDNYKQSISTINTVLGENPDALKNVLEDISERNEHLKAVTAGKSNPDTSVHYFYTIIGMACLYGGFLGIKEVLAVQANQSSQGARVSVAPTHKLKVFIVSIFAAITIQLIAVFILLLFLKFILKVDFGNQLTYIVLTCIGGTFTGVTFGTMISAVVKKGEGVKIGILIGGTMTMSVLSGMMFAGMKTLFTRNIPILAYINPANLISDSFYALYFYNDYNHYYVNLSFLIGFAILFGLITFAVMRRQKYASI